MLSATGIRTVQRNFSLAPSSPSAFKAGEYMPLKPKRVEDIEPKVEDIEPNIWPVTGVEECFMCCYLGSQGARDELAPAPDAWERACDWIEVTGAEIQVSANGLYQKMGKNDDPAAQGRPVYVHTSGLLYLFFLARACMHESASVCPRRGPGWVISDTIGRDSARVLAWAATNAPQDVIGNYWHQWDGNGYVKVPLARPSYNTTFNPDGSVNSSVLDRIENPDLVTVKVMCASSDVGKAHHSPIPFWGTPGQRILNFTTTVGFIDGKEHCNMSLPDRDGVLVSTGNPQHISALGTLVSPITAHSGKGRLSQVEFGLGWETVNVTSEAAGLFAAAFELGGLRYCFVNRSTCFQLCNNMKLDQSSPEAKSCKRFSCVLPLPRAAFGSSCMARNHTSAKLAAQHPIDAIIIEGPLQDEEYTPRLGNAPGPTGRLLFVPVAGIWNEKAFCRMPQRLAGSVPNPCRAVEFTLPVGADNGTLVRDGTEGDCLTWRDDRSVPTLGLAWLNIGNEKPTTGEPLANASELANALADKTEFTTEEWSAFGIKDVHEGQFVKASTGYFTPGVSCRAPQGTLKVQDSTRILVTKMCVMEDIALSRQPVCVPEYVSRLSDRRAYPRVGDEVEIGAAREVAGHGNTSEMRERELRGRAQLRVSEVVAVANEANPYTYQLQAENSVPASSTPLEPLDAALYPRVSSPIRLTMFMSAESVHYLEFSSGHMSAERVRERQQGVGEFVIKSR
jgi:hypothetical protein